MSRTVSARIPNKTHSELIERCNKVGCTINEWIGEAIQYLLTNSSEFDFGDDEFEEDKSSEIESVQAKRITDDANIQKSSASK